MNMAIAIWVFLILEFKENGEVSTIVPSSANIFIVLPEFDYIPVEPAFIQQLSLNFSGCLTGYKNSRKNQQISNININYLTINSFNVILLLKYPFVFSKTLLVSIVIMTY